MPPSTTPAYDSTRVEEVLGARLSHAVGQVAASSRTKTGRFRTFLAASIEDAEVDGAQKVVKEISEEGQEAAAKTVKARKAEKREEVVETGGGGVGEGWHAGAQKGLVYRWCIRSMLNHVNICNIMYLYHSISIDIHI